MNRAEAVTKLKGYAEAVRALGATSLYVYGSTARNEAGEDSDIDVFIDYDRNSKFNLLDLVDIKLLLEAELQMAVATSEISLWPKAEADGADQSDATAKVIKNSINP